MLVARIPAERTPARAFGFFATLALLALAVGAGAYPVVRRLTRRLERLKSGVEALGQGDLSARVRVEGRDEVAALAASFNRSAEQIERLVGAHRTLLANASHELRSPLARIRMAIEMLGAEANPALRAEVARDIAELDALVDEILLASRLDAVAAIGTPEEVDLLALAAEESARVGAALDGSPTVVRGDAKLFRRMIRNLLENAKRHGGERRWRSTCAAREASSRCACVTAGQACRRGARAHIRAVLSPAGSREGQGGAGSASRSCARSRGATAVRCVVSRATAAGRASWSRCPRAAEPRAVDRDTWQQAAARRRGRPAGTQRAGCGTPNGRTRRAPSSVLIPDP